MQQRLSFIALGVEDVNRARAFYEALGWQTHPAGPEAMPLFQMPGGLVFALYSRSGLAEDSGLSAPSEQSNPPSTSITLAHNVATTEEVAEILAQAEAAGATILKPPQEAFWGGFHGHLADPDGHIWEICFNPFWPLDAQGMVTLPES